jgi:hypothetical protein
MDRLTDQIVELLMSSKSLGQGIHVMGDLLVYWSRLADVEKLRVYLQRTNIRERMPQARYIPTEEEIQLWPESRVRNYVVRQFSDEVFYEETLRSQKPSELKDQSRMSEKVDVSPSFDSHSLAKRLSELEPLKATSVLIQAIITWAYTMNTDIIRQHAIECGRYHDEWVRRDFVNHVFYSLHTHITGE